MTPRFLDFIPFILELEGSDYEDVPGDSGGPTKFGIDSASHPGVDIRNLTREQAIAIYYQEWSREGCESLTYPMGELFFDCCVNSGYGEARQILARATTPAAFVAEYDRVYRLIVANHPQDEKFLTGWLNRNQALRKRLGIAA